jgi:hypothetical protein
MGSFVVFCSKDDKLEKKLKELAEKEKISKTLLTTYDPTGPEGYNVAKDSDVTVVLYTERRVIVNHAFKKGQLDAKAIEKVLGDVKKILPEK